MNHIARPLFLVLVPATVLGKLSATLVSFLTNGSAPRLLYVGTALTVWYISAIILLQWVVFRDDSD